MGFGKMHVTGKAKKPENVKYVQPVSLKEGDCRKLFFVHSSRSPKEIEKLKKAANNLLSVN